MFLLWWSEDQGLNSQPCCLQGGLRSQSLSSQVASVLSRYYGPWAVLVGSIRQNGGIFSYSWGALVLPCWWQACMCYHVGDRLACVESCWHSLQMTNDSTWCYVSALIGCYVSAPTGCHFSTNWVLFKWVVCFSTNWVSCFSTNWVLFKLRGMFQHQLGVMFQHQLGVI